MSEGDVIPGLTPLLMMGVLYVLFSAVRQNLGIDTGIPAVDLLGPLAAALAVTFLTLTVYHAVVE